MNQFMSGKYWYLFSLVSVFFLFFSGCAADNPEILRSDVRILSVQDSSGNFSEKLSVFVLFKSGADPGNFGSMTVTHTGTGIEWNLPALEAVVVSPAGKKKDSLWIGNPSLSPVYSGEGFFFPEGSYYLIVRDLAGNEASSSFSLEKTVFPEVAPVSLSVDDSGNKEIFITVPESPGDFTVIVLFLLDGEGMPFYSFFVSPDLFNGRVASVPFSMLEKELKSAGKEFVSRLRSVQCYAGNNSGSAGVLLFPVSLGYDNADE